MVVGVLTVMWLHLHPTLLFTFRTSRLTGESSTCVLLVSHL
jgi:hypothetical protein